MAQKPKKTFTLEDLTLSQRNVLKWLKTCKETATPALVAGMQPCSSALPPSAIKRHLEALQKKGFAETVECPDGIIRWQPATQT